MADEKICQGCHQKHRCQEVYEHLSKMEGPSLVLKVVVAFLLPILVFIGSIAIFEGLFSEIIQSKELQTIAGLLLALVVSTSFVFIARVINRNPVKNK